MQEVEREYIIRSTRAVAFGGKKVTFLDHSQSNIPLPSPRYLAMHAAFAKALHQSGAGQYFDSALSDNMHEASVLSSDGTSDIGFLLSSLVLGG